MADDTLKFGFVCVQNAGRSQIAAAFAERERSRRGLEDEIEILTGGTNPADEVHPEVVVAMDELGIDVSDRTPREVSTDELNDCTVVATMECSTLDLEADIAVRDWALDDPHGKPVEEVRAIREDVERRVSDLFDEFVVDE